MTEVLETDTSAKAQSSLETPLKRKHQAMWAFGNYPAVATEVIAPLGPILAAAVGAGPGQRVLDVGAGSGNAAIPVALAGADVVASDLTPELLETGRQDAAEQGADIWSGNMPTRRRFLLPMRVRHGHLVRRCDVRTAPPGER